MDEREIIALPPGWPTFRDHRGHRYSLEGGIGSVLVNRTRARVWIWAYSRKGRTLPTHSIRLDLGTARLFHNALGQAITDAEDAVKQAKARGYDWVEANQ